MNFYERLFSRNEVKVFPGRKMIKFLTLITFLAITIVACLGSWWFFNLFFFFVCEIQPRPLVSLGRKTHKKTASCAGSIPGKREETSTSYPGVPFVMRWKIRSTSLTKRIAASGNEIEETSASREIVG